MNKDFYESAVVDKKYTPSVFSDYRVVVQKHVMKTLEAIYDIPEEHLRVDHKGLEEKVLDINVRFK